MPCGGHKILLFIAASISFSNIWEAFSVDTSLRKPYCACNKFLNKLRYGIFIQWKMKVNKGLLVDLKKNIIIC